MDMFLFSKEIPSEFNEGVSWNIAFQRGEDLLVVTYFQGNESYDS